MYGVIDIGSNTIRLNIYKVEDGVPSVLLSKKDATGLASYIHHGRMSADGIERAVLVLLDFKVLLDEFNIEGFAFATAALRNIENSMEAIDELSKRTGLSIVLLPGETEAELDFIGITCSVSLNSGLMVDIGGASTELVIYKGHEILKSFSMPVGSLNMYNRHVQHLIPGRTERRDIKQEVLNCLTQDDDFRKGTWQNIIGMCGVGGTIRAACCLNNELFDLPADTQEINAPNIKKIIKLLENDEEDDLISIDTLEVLLRTVPDRVRTVLPGLIILHTLIKYFGIKTIHVSRTGVREGYLYRQLQANIASAAQPAAPETAETKQTASSGLQQTADNHAEDVSDHAKID